MHAHAQTGLGVNMDDSEFEFLLNEHGDLYFLLHKNIVHIILLNLEKK